MAFLSWARPWRLHVLRFVFIGLAIALAGGGTATHEVTGGRQGKGTHRESTRTDPMGQSWSTSSGWMWDHIEDED